MAGFILFTVIGTLSHEFGHFAVARLLGYEASLHYGYTSYEGDITARDSFLITLAGPLQTITTGIIGFFLAVRYLRNANHSVALSFKQWLMVFLSLFWLREVFNFLQDVIGYVATGSFSTRNDEIRLSLSCGLHELGISLPAALIAVFVLAYVFFKIIPIRQRLLFILSGLIGGALGFYLWMYLIGPVLMP